MKKYRWIILGVASILLYFATEAAMRCGVMPTGHAGTLREFLAWSPAAERFRTVEIGGKGHVIAYGKNGGVIPSGPSAYVFDDAGRLVDWSADMGDDPVFNTRWKAQESYSGGPQLTRREVEMVAATQAVR